MNHKEIERWYRLKNIKKASLILVLLSVALLVTGLAASKFIQGDSEGFDNVTINGGMRIDNFAYSSPGARPWELKAATAIISEKLDNVSLRNPRIVYKGGKGGEILLSAESGKLDKKSRSIFAQGNVVVSYKDLQFTAGEMDYSDEQKIVKTSSTVSLESRNFHITGQGLKVLLDNEEMIIQQDVRASISNISLLGPKEKIPL